MLYSAWPLSMAVLFGLRYSCILFFRRCKQSGAGATFHNARYMSKLYEFQDFRNFQATDWVQVNVQTQIQCQNQQRND